MSEVDVRSERLPDSLVSGILESVVDGQCLPQPSRYPTETTDDRPRRLLSAAIGNLGDADETAFPFHQRIETNVTFSRYHRITLPVSRDVPTVHFVWSQIDGYPLPQGAFLYRIRNLLRMPYLVPASQEGTQIDTGTVPIPSPPVLGVDVLVDGLMADAVETEFDRQAASYLFRRVSLLQSPLYVGTDEWVLEARPSASHHDSIPRLLLCQTRRIPTHSFRTVASQFPADRPWRASQSQSDTS